MLQKWLLRLLSRICFLADSLYFFSLQSGFTLGKWLLSFTQDSSKLSSNLNCFGDQITNKNTKTCIKWLKSLSRVLNMPIELKRNNYYSKVFKRVNYKLWNSTFLVVIIDPSRAKTKTLIFHTVLSLLPMLFNAILKYLSYNALLPGKYPSVSTR